VISGSSSTISILRFFPSVLVDDGICGNDEILHDAHAFTQAFLKCYAVNRHLCFPTITWKFREVQLISY
jgi:hypothetical protein